MGRALAEALRGRPPGLRGGRRRARLRPLGDLLRGPGRAPDRDRRLPARPRRDVRGRLARRLRGRAAPRARDGPLAGRVLGAGRRPGDGLRRRRCASSPSAAPPCARPAGRRRGRMAALLGLSDDDARALADEAGDVWPANYNCPGQVVVSGRAAGIERLLAARRRAWPPRDAAAGGRRLPLPADGAGGRRACARPSTPGTPRPPDPPFLSTTTCAIEPPGRHARGPARPAHLARPLRRRRGGRPRRRGRALRRARPRARPVRAWSSASAATPPWRRSASPTTSTAAASPDAGRARHRRQPRDRRGLRPGPGRGRLRRGRRLRHRRRGRRRDRRGGRGRRPARATSTPPTSPTRTQAGGLVEAVEEALGPLDALVLNAGITRDGLAVRMSADDWSAVLDTNLSGAFYTARPALRGMLRRRAGSIVAVSSVVGLIGNAGQANYAAAKAGPDRPRARARARGRRPRRARQRRRPGLHRDRHDRGRSPTSSATAILACTPLGRLGEPEPTWRAPSPSCARPRRPSSPARCSRWTAGWRCRERAGEATAAARRGDRARPGHARSASGAQENWAAAMAGRSGAGRDRALRAARHRHHDRVRGHGLRAHRLHRAPRGAADGPLRPARRGGRPPRARGRRRSTVVRRARARAPGPLVGSGIGGLDSFVLPDAHRGAAGRRTGSRRSSSRW